MFSKNFANLTNFRVSDANDAVHLGPRRAPCTFASVRTVNFGALADLKAVSK